MKTNKEIVEIKVDLTGDLVKALNIGVDSNTKKRIVIFQFPNTNEVECRGYGYSSQRYASGEVYEEIELSPIQQDYAINLLKEKNICN